MTSCTAIRLWAVALCSEKVLTPRYYINTFFFLKHLLYWTISHICQARRHPCIPLFPGALSKNHAAWEAPSNHTDHHCTRTHGVGQVRYHKVQLTRSLIYIILSLSHNFSNTFSCWSFLNTNFRSLHRAALTFHLTLYLCKLFFTLLES